MDEVVAATVVEVVMGSVEVVTVVMSPVEVVEGPFLLFRFHIYILTLSLI